MLLITCSESKAGNCLVPEGWQIWNYSNDNKKGGKQDWGEWIKYNIKLLNTASLALTVGERSLNNVTSATIKFILLFTLKFHINLASCALSLHVSVCSFVFVMSDFL